MCGIAGIIGGSAGREARMAAICAMNAALAHRGPDGEGAYASPDGYASLGHRRLAVIDRSPAGQEPLSNEDGTLWLTFNGEIYNYRELRAGLLARGHRFKSATDAETVLHLYEEQGVSCLDSLDGMFAFALWDEKERKLFMARDRFGEKPLSYAEKDGRLVFASETAAVFAGLGYVPAPDTESFAYFFSYNHVRSPRTGFTGVYDLPPAHYGIFHNGRLSIRRYWQLDFSRKVRIPYADAVTEVRRLLEKSVRGRMHADVPLGVFLSGGVDSSAIAAIAARHVPRLTTFSAGFAEAGIADELPQARETARRIGSDHREYSFSADISELLPRLVRLYGKPYADSSALAVYCLAERARTEVAAAMGGDGGDEAFGGYRRYAYWNAFRYFKKDAYERIASYPYFPSALPPEPLRSLDGVFSHGITTFLPDDLLVKTDRAAMAHGLEMRSPFLGRELMEFAASLPASWKVRFFGTKLILKDALRGTVPDGVLAGPKRGFEVPVDAWFRGKWHAWAREILLDARTARRGYFDREKIAALLEGHRTGSRRNGQRIWLLLCFELWNREFADRASMITASPAKSIKNGVMAK